jgi:hypothetical protein
MRETTLPRPVSFALNSASAQHAVTVQLRFGSREYIRLSGLRVTNASRCHTYFLTAVLQLLLHWAGSRRPALWGGECHIVELQCNARIDRGINEGWSMLSPFPG